MRIPLFPLFVAFAVASVPAGHLFSKTPAPKKAAGETSKENKESPKGQPVAQVAAALVYEQNFESMDAGPVSKEFLPLAGEFSVVLEDGNRFLELPGAPLDTFGALFGPSSGDPGSLQGRFFGTKTGRKFPTFGLSLRGAGGYRLQVSPGKGQLEVYKGDDPLVGVPFSWQSGAWTWLKLIVRKVDSGWVIEGRAWAQGEK
jgi:hypothetical protein